MGKTLSVTAAAGIALITVLSTPATAAAEVDRVEDVSTVLAVAMGEDFPLASLMRAECAFVQRVERPDGSALETMRCRLSDEPVMIPEFQGEVPTTAVRYGGGSCEWISDYWASVSGIDVYAASYRVVVTPAGTVHATAHYPAQPLACG